MLGGLPAAAVNVLGQLVGAEGKELADQFGNEVVKAAEDLANWRGVPGAPPDRQRGGDGQTATSAVLKSKEEKKTDEEEDEYVIPAVNRPEPTPWNVGAPAQPIQVAQPIMPPNLQDMVNNVYLNSMQRYQPRRFLLPRRF